MPTSPAALDSRGKVVRRLGDSDNSVLELNEEESHMFRLVWFRWQRTGSAADALYTGGNPRDGEVNKSVIVSPFPNSLMYQLHRHVLPCGLYPTDGWPMSIIVGSSAGRRVLARQSLSTARENFCVILVER
ncbi:hypothetical protein M378DRAFT_173437 [Amanita muscaria Koide BX008]|uniref:Uncharacterized protein n=1 Tax=Amanita muscaria (strain Koide BX008) TaxID=946122 RepID=A0A0C2WG97_AMAMK|nr:hypothetical protein M378DRAFT_173437 [Amanita muscaria Koide BX008]